MEQAFMRWLAATGAEFQKVVWPAEVETTVEGPAPRGVVAAVDLAAGEEVMRIPECAMLLPEHGVRLLRPLLVTEQAAELLEMDEVVLALNILLIASATEERGRSCTTGDSAAVTPVLALLQAELAQRGAYIACLPPLSDFHAMLSCWSDTELQWLDDDVISSALAARHAIAHEFAAVSACLQLAQESVSLGTAADPAAIALASILRPIWTHASYHWAKYCVQSRAFIFGLDMDELFMCEGTAGMLPMAMVPLADMLNHRGTDAAPLCVADWVRAEAPSFVATVDSSRSHGSGGGGAGETNASGGGWYVLRTGRAVRKGEEICISYGDRNGRDLLENYGFCLPPSDNSHTSLSIPLSALADAACGSSSRGERNGDSATPSTLGVIDASAACVVTPPTPEVGGVKAAVLDALGHPDSLELTLEVPPSADLMMLLRILVARDEDITPALRPPQQSVLSLSGVSRSALRNIPPEYFERPLSRDNELRTLDLLYCLAISIANQLQRTQGGGIATLTTDTSPSDLLGMLSSLDVSVGEGDDAATGVLTGPSGTESLSSLPLSVLAAPAVAPVVDDECPWRDAVSLDWDVWVASGRHARAAAATQYRTGVVAVLRCVVQYVADMRGVAAGTQ